MTNTEISSEYPAKWFGLPAIATVARLLCRGLTLHNEYLRLENGVLKSKTQDRIHFTDDERRPPHPAMGGVAIVC